MENKIQDIPSSSPNKKKVFKSNNGVSHTMRNIRDKLSKEHAQIKAMLFLKQLDEDAIDGTGNNKGRHVVVWDEATLNLIKELQEEEQRMNNTNYEKLLQPKKLRPRDLISGNTELRSLYEFATPYKSRLG